MFLNFYRAPYILLINKYESILTNEFFKNKNDLFAIIKQSQI